MSKDLTTSQIDRQNILNNPYALSEIEKAAGIRGIPFDGKVVMLKDQVAAFFEVTPRTIDNYLLKNEEELTNNGYEVLKGKRLKAFMLEIDHAFADETVFVNKSMVRKIGVFDFRAFLNLAMLMKESERAGLLRKVILDIVIDTINKRTGGGTKYINQRDEDFIHSAFAEGDYRKPFTDALKDCIDMGNFKYSIYTHKIYVSIFKEQASEYRSILRLENREKIRDTLYSEVLDLIAAYECGFADNLRRAYEEKGCKLSALEVDALFVHFESQAHWKPLIEKARVKMASRDLGFRDALHMELQNYITPLRREEFDRF